MAAVVPPFYNFTGNYKPSGQDRTAAERNYVAEATRRRLRILLAGFFLIQIQCLNRRRRSEDRVHRFLPDHI